MVSVSAQCTYTSRFKMVYLLALTKEILNKDKNEINAASFKLQIQVLKEKTQDFGCLSIL